MPVRISSRLAAGMTKRARAGAAASIVVSMLVPVFVAGMTSAF